MLMSHLGRPVECGSAKENQIYSLAPVAEHLALLLNCRVPLIEDWQQGLSLADGEVCLLENVRFNPGEKDNSDQLAQLYAAVRYFCDGCFWHCASCPGYTHGVAKFKVCGPLLAAELNALSQALAKPARPMVAIVGGSKVSTKLSVLDALSDKVDQLIVGGGGCL